MQWWCSARTTAWSWTAPVAYPGVWLFVLAIAYVYWRLSRGSETTKGARFTGWIGVGIIDIALDWPLGPLAAGYLASAHAVQFLLLAFIAPPLILIGARDGIVARGTRQGARGAGMRALSALLHPVVAAIAFNIVIIATHVPRVNDTLMPMQLGAMAVDVAWIVAGLWFWWPLIVPVPHRPLFAVPLRMLYLFLGSIVHTGIAIVMLVQDHPMYGVFELAPRATAMSAITDIKVAGGIMELGGAGIVFGVLTVMFFRWAGTGAERKSS